MFQFLIGSLKTKDYAHDKIQWITFQFLIGSLKTREGKLLYTIMKLGFNSL